MPEPFDALAGHWWRFDSYEMKDGYLRPRQGARLHAYDPWELFRDSRKARGADPPYQVLLNLVQGLSLEPRPGPGQLLELAPGDEEQIVGWCQQFGLLGLLPHQTMLASLTPRLESLQEDPKVLVPTQFHYCRTVEGWVTWDQTAAIPRLQNQPKKAGTPIPVPERSKSFAPVGAMFRPLHEQLYQHKPLSQTWGPFFPDGSGDVAESYPYPAPLTKEFWLTYAEPVYEFVEAARLLLNTMELFEAHKKVAGTRSDENAVRLRLALDQFHALIETVSPTISQPLEGAPRQEWLATSLLGALAMMALLDLTESRRLLTCDTCGKLFVTKAYQASYCSMTCRNTAQKRRHRARRKKPAHQTRRSGS